MSEEPDLISDLGIGQFNTTQSIEDMKLDKNMVSIMLVNIALLYSDCTLSSLRFGCCCP